MPFRRVLLASSALFIVALVWNTFLHGVVLRDLNASVAGLRRPDLADYFPLSLLLTFAVTTLFVWGYSRFARNGSVREGLTYGIFFALLAGILVDLNQFIFYPIPASVALAWFAGGAVEFSLYGFLVARLYPLR